MPHEGIPVVLLGLLGVESEFCELCLFIVLYGFSDIISRIMEKRKTSNMEESMVEAGGSGRLKWK